MTILTRARKLAGPDRDFDAEIYRLAYDDGGWVGGNWYVERFMETVGSSRVIALPAYTASLDAIVGLIEAKLPGVARENGNGVGIDGKCYFGRLTGDDYCFEEIAATEPVALCCALLAALNPQETTP